MRKNSIKNTRINGEVQRFARGDSLPEGYFYIETYPNGSYQTAYDCRPGKEQVVVKKSMQLLALRCGDSADHLEFMIDSAAVSYTHLTLPTP